MRLQQINGLENLSPATETKKNAYLDEINVKAINYHFPFSIINDIQNRSETNERIIE